jgi:recombination protein RecA
MIDGEGVSREGTLIDMAQEAGLVSRSGAWYSYGEERIGQGRENTRQFLKDHPDVADEIERKIKEHYDIPAQSGRNGDADK